jgi:hypothetical protein
MLYLFNGICLRLQRKGGRNIMTKANFQMIDDLQSANYFIRFAVDNLEYAIKRINREKTRVEKAFAQIKANKESAQEILEGLKK